MIATLSVALMLSPIEMGSLLGLLVPATALSGAEAVVAVGDSASAGSAESQANPAGAGGDGGGCTTAANGSKQMMQSAIIAWDRKSEKAVDNLKMT